MRTAEEILITEFDSDKDSLQTAIILNTNVRKIISAINEARKEAIEECARVASIKIYKPNGVRQLHSADVDREKLLSLIKELK